jgi:pyruvate,water dikinase
MKINPEPTLENVGGKGFQLLALQKICSVPDFFLIRFDTPNEIESVDVQSGILAQFSEMGFSKVAVRSSATTEDSVSASFAGMFETELNVTKETLIPAIKKVLTSAAENRVREYCTLNNLEFKSVQMRVIVQQMVDSRVSGVCFSRESKATNSILIEACYGLGEALVSGIVTPDTYRVDRDSYQITSQNIGFQKLMYDCSATTESVSVPFHRRNAKKLTDEEIRELAQLCINIEQSLGYFSADIEWAHTGDKLYMLQVRPFVGIQ